VQLKFIYETIEAYKESLFV